MPGQAPQAEVQPAAGYGECLFDYRSQKQVGNRRPQRCLAAAQRIEMLSRNEDAGSTGNISGLRRLFTLTIDMSAVSQKTEAGKESARTPAIEFTAGSWHRTWCLAGGHTCSTLRSESHDDYGGQRSVR